MFRTSTSCLVVCSVRGVRAAGAALLVGRGPGPPPGGGVQPRQPRRGARARPRHAGPRHLAAGAGGDQPRLATPPLHPRLQRAGGGGGECRLCSRITITSSQDGLGARVYILSANIIIALSLNVFLSIGSIFCSIRILKLLPVTSPKYRESCAEGF